MAYTGTNQSSTSSNSSSGSSKSAQGHGKKSKGQSDAVAPGEPSPTYSVGSFVNIDHPDMAQVRQMRQATSMKERVEPRGFDYTGNTCYRNSLFIMLLCCDRLMGWIQHCHLLSIAAQSEENNSGDASATIMTDLQVFWETFWSNKPATQANKALKAFWTKCFAGTKIPKEQRWQYTGQNDPTELLVHMIVQFRSQLDDAGLHNDIQSFDAMLCTRWTLRNTCFSCSAEKGLKFRSVAGAEVHDTMQIPLPQPNDSHDISSLSLGDLLHSMVKTHNKDGWECDDCRQHMQTEKAALSPKSKELVRLMDKWNQQKQAGSSRWNYLRHLPEVLMMQILRWETQIDSKGVQITKIKTRVEIPEEIDLRDMLEPDETTVPAAQRRNTRYRLVGIVSHAGTKNAGHYINFARSAERKWCKVDGVKVEELENFAQVQADYYYEVGGTRTHRVRELFTPYVLCWERLVDRDESSLSISSGVRSSGFKASPTNSEARQSAILSPANSSESSVRLNLHESRPPPSPRRLEDSERNYVVSVLNNLSDDHIDDVLNLVKVHGFQTPQGAYGDLSVPIGELPPAAQAALLQYAQRHDPERSVWGRLKGRIRIGGVPVNFNLRLPCSIGNFLERTHGKAAPPITFDLEEWGLIVPNPYNAGPDEAYYGLSTNPPRGTITRDNEKNIKQSDKEHTDLWMSLGLERRTGVRFEELYKGKLSPSTSDKPADPATQETRAATTDAEKTTPDKGPSVDLSTPPQPPSTPKTQTPPPPKAASTSEVPDQPQDQSKPKPTKKPAASTKPKPTTKASTTSKKKPTKAPPTARTGTKRKRAEADTAQPDACSEEDQSPRGAKRRNTRQGSATASTGPARSTRGAATRSRNGGGAENQADQVPNVEEAAPSQQTRAKQKMEQEKKRMQEALKGMGRIPKKSDAVPAKAKQGTKRKASEEVEKEADQDGDGLAQVDRRTKRQKGGRPSGFRDSMGDNMFGRHMRGKGDEESDDDERPLAEVMRKRRKR